MVTTAAMSSLVEIVSVPPCSHSSDCCLCRLSQYDTHQHFILCNAGSQCCTDVFNHRNQSLRKWIVEEHMLGKMGMAHPAVDGYLIDDWYTDYHGMYGPSEIPVSVATACPKLERANICF